MKISKTPHFPQNGSMKLAAPSFKKKRKYRPSATPALTLLIAVRWQAQRDTALAGRGAAQARGHGCGSTVRPVG